MAVLPCCNSSLLIIFIPVCSLIILNLNLLVCMFVLFLSLLTCLFLILQMVHTSHMLIKHKSHFFILLCKTKQIMALHTIQNVLSSCYLHFSSWLMIFTSLAHHPEV